MKIKRMDSLFVGMPLIVAAAILLWMPSALSLITGFNQAWFNNYYSSSFLKKGYSSTEAHRLLKMTKEANGTVIRMWLFEGVQMSSIRWDVDGQPIGLRAEFIPNLIHFIAQAKALNIQVYLTLFDGNSLRYSNSKVLSNHFKKLLNNEEHLRDAFVEKVLTPLLHALKPQESSIFAIDLVNEMDFLVDSLIHPTGFHDGWSSAIEFVSQFRNQIHSVVSTPVTASFSFWFPAKRVLDQRIPLDIVDFYDVHLYNNDGEISHCEEMREFSAKYNKPLVMGEFGQLQFPASYDDKKQQLVTEGFLRNAPRCGFKAALAWRLSDIRPGYNKEARYSYEAFGKPRPAYYVFKRVSEETNKGL